MSEKAVSSKIIPVIMCGGAGSRLWPASREAFPKQLLTFGSGKSLLQETLARVTGEAYGEPIIVTGQDHRFLVAEQTRIAHPHAEIVLEPARRDSCAAVAAACALALARDPEAVVFVLAADHAISDPASFNAHVRRGLRAADEGRLVTFGIRPDRPATGYGYIRPGEALGAGGDVRAIAAFVEKPDAATAERYLQEGYLWNSGNFLFRARSFLDELARLAPDIHGTVLASVAGATRDLDFLRLEPETFLSTRADSIDFAVMEKTSLAAVVPSDFPWSDIGAWSAVWELAAKDADGNASFGDAVFHESEGSYVHSPHVLTAVIGLRDVVVVTTRDAVMVVDKARSEEVKKLVARLSGMGRKEASEHLRCYRPWGDYEQVDRGERYQVKRITVKAGGKLSLQSHVHRAEHWVVVKGTARATIDGVEQMVQENQSVYIPLGSVHRLENPGRIPVEMIEVQSGSYLGEDDIIRYEDIYNRS
jgi:mannose-1-phosphate guanylyltransferase/mannose-6-phosphate isomerase